MSKIPCLVLNITKSEKKNAFIASRNFYSSTLTMCCRNDLFSGWNLLELYSDWSLSPKSDQHEFSLNNRSNELMNKGEVF